MRKLEYSFLSGKKIINDITTLRSIEVKAKVALFVFHFYRLATSRVASV
jgi:hypothetical protein